MRVITSQMNFRFTCASVRRSAERTAIVMYGSLCWRKYTGPNQASPDRAARNAGSRERSRPEPIDSSSSRETASRSCPEESSCATSVTAGTSPSSLMNSRWRCSMPWAPSCGSAA
jgi:hypothetical protein